MGSERIIKAKGILKFDEHFDKKLESIGIYLLGIVLVCGMSLPMSYLIYGSIRNLLDYASNHLILMLVTISLGCWLLLKIWMYRRKKNI